MAKTVNVKLTPQEIGWITASLEFYHNDMKEPEDSKQQMGEVLILLGKMQDLAEANRMVQVPVKGA